MKFLFLSILLLGWACGEYQLGPSGEVRSAANMASLVKKHTGKIIYHAGRVSEVSKLDKLLKHVNKVYSHVHQARAKFAAEQINKVSGGKSWLHTNSEFQQWGVRTQASLAYRRDNALHTKINLAKARNSKKVKLVLQRLQEIDNMLTKPLPRIGMDDLPPKPTP